MSATQQTAHTYLIEPGLMVIHGNRQEDLRDLLVAWLQRAPLQPLENEVMLVQSNGIAQWLKLALARPIDAGGLEISESSLIKRSKSTLTGEVRTRMPFELRNSTSAISIMVMISLAIKP